MNKWLWILVLTGTCAACTLLFVKMYYAPNNIKPMVVPLPSGFQATRPTSSKAVEPTAHEILDQRQVLDETVWKKEVQAQEFEDTFISMWDAMRARKDDQYKILSACPFDKMLIGSFSASELHKRGINTSTMNGPFRALNPRDWKQLLELLDSQGYVLEHSEWHHAAFSPASAPQEVTTSKISMKLFIYNDRNHTRLVVSGILDIIWSQDLDNQGHHLIKDIDASHLSMASRAGTEEFIEVFSFSPQDRKIDPQATIDPVLVYDISGHGKPDILLPSINTLLTNKSVAGHIAFESSDLCTHPVAQTSMETGPYVTAAIVGNFIGNGHPDLLECGPGLAPTLFPGEFAAPYREFGEPVSNLDPRFFILPVCMTAGDVLGNGALDVWIGQYRRPYVDGNLPVPYWDANDGFPSFFLMNDGRGHFSDATPGSGLDGKRFRRNYSASFFDLEGNGKLGLVTINDFAGAEVFSGLGNGQFKNITDSILDQHSSFGMSHVIADIDGDGKLDLFIAGMGSTTARRLEQMKLGRPEFPDQQRMRMPMAYGNRLLLGTSDHHYLQAPYNDTISRTGWSWGSAVIDPDNSGDLDIYLSNGNISQSTAKDYCTRFWTQDIYMGKSEPSNDWRQFFQLENERLKGYSWNPFEHKALLMNEGHGEFRDTAYLMNLGFEYDARQVMAVDFDGDGHTDLLEVELRPGVQLGFPTRPVLHIYRNESHDTNHWLEVSVPDAPHLSPLGATITVEAGGRRRIAAIVAGDSYRCQHPPSAHFGLGAVDHIDAVTVTWSNGRSKSILKPAVDAELIVLP